MSVGLKKMRCDICGIDDLHCILKLDPKKFTSKTIKTHKQKPKNVCFYCGFQLGRDGYYRFGGFWYKVLCNSNLRLLVK